MCRAIFVRASLGSAALQEFVIGVVVVIGK
jgi:hypothetical protein